MLAASFPIVPSWTAGSTADMWLGIAVIAAVLVASAVALIVGFRRTRGMERAARFAKPFGPTPSATAA